MAITSYLSVLIQYVFRVRVTREFNDFSFNTSLKFDPNCGVVNPGISISSSNSF